MTSQNLTPLERAQEKMKELRASGWKPVQLNPVDKAKKNPNSLKMAIRAMCWVCSGADHDPGVKQRVGACATTSCPLWSHRPWQSTTELDSVDDEEILEPLLENGENHVTAA